MFKSKLFWGGVLLCVVVLFGVLLHRANQPQETIRIYKTVVPEKRAKRLNLQTNKRSKRTKILIKQRSFLRLQIPMCL